MKSIETKLGNKNYQVTVNGVSRLVYKEGNFWYIAGFGHRFNTKKEAVKWISE